MDIITLESDEEDSHQRRSSNGTSNPAQMASSGGTATVHVREAPLDLEALFTATAMGQVSLQSVDATSRNAPRLYTNAMLSGQIAANLVGMRALNSAAPAVNGVSHIVFPRKQATKQPLPSTNSSHHGFPKRPRMMQDVQILQPALPLAHRIPAIPAAAMAQQPNRCTILSSHAGTMPNTNNVYRDANSLANVQAKLAQFATTYLETFDPKQNISDEEFAGQFRCTYNGCNKLLSNNVTFMYHLWAHVNRFKTVLEEDVTNLQLSSNSSRQETTSSEQKDDVARLRTCPECLVVQPSPHRMHLHYHRVHKQVRHLEASDLTVCAICEIVLRKVPDSVLQHFQRHGLYDTPYNCKKCKYKNSSREALLHHFMENHSGTSIVLCPFCLMSFNIPYGDRQRRVVLMKAYVQHILDHEAYHPRLCRQCAIRFIPADQHTMQHRMSTHAKLHGKGDPKWKFDRKSGFEEISEIHALHKSHSKVVLWPVENPQVCVECRHTVNGVRARQKHFRELKRCPLPNCNYETTCSVSLELHEVLKVCQGKNGSKTNRWPFGKPKVAKNFPLLSACNTLPTNMKEGNRSLRLQCSSCPFGTTDAHLMCKHLGARDKCLGATTRDSSSSPLLRNSNHPDDGTALDSSTNEKDEVDAFEEENLGVARLRDIELLEGDVGKNEVGVAIKENPKAVEDALSVILPLAKVNYVKGNRLVVKYLTCETLTEDNAGGDELKLRELISSFKSMMDSEDVEDICKCLLDARAERESDD